MEVKVMVKLFGKQARISTFMTKNKRLDEFLTIPGNAQQSDVQERPQAP